MKQGLGEIYIQFENDRYFPIVEVNHIILQTLNIPYPLNQIQSLIIWTQ